MADTMNNSMRGVTETGMEHHAMADADGNQAMGGKYFYEPMALVYEGLGGEVLYETRGLELVQNLQTGEILGVKAEDPVPDLNWSSGFYICATRKSCELKEGMSPVTH